MLSENTYIPCKKRLFCFALYIIYISIKVMQYMGAIANRTERHLSLTSMRKILFYLIRCIFLKTLHGVSSFALLLMLVCPATVFCQEDLPVRAKVLVEEMDNYKQEISQKAQELIGAKMSKIKASLEVEMKRQINSGNTEGARAILAVVEKWNNEQQVQQRRVEIANARWKELFFGESLPSDWDVVREGASWKYSEGILNSESDSEKEGAVFMHKIEPGDIVVRGELQVVDSGDPREEHRVGIGFIDSKERVTVAYTHAPGTIFVHSSLFPGDGLLGHEKSSACQKKFSELQVAWIGTRFMLFVSGRLLIDQDIGARRGGDDLALLANNSTGLFRNVGFRVPDEEDLKRLNSRKALK